MYETALADRLHIKSNLVYKELDLWGRGSGVKRLVIELEYQNIPKG